MKDASKPVSAKPSEGFLAYRLEGMEATDKGRSLGVTGLLPEVFAKLWTAVLPAETPISTKAYSFGRAAGIKKRSSHITIVLDETSGE